MYSWVQFTACGEKWKEVDYDVSMTKDLDVAIQLAGIEIDGPINTGDVFAPPVREVGGGLLIYHSGDRAKHRMKKGLLADFLNLTEGSDRKVAAFCRKWGVFGLCQHGVPMMHGPNLHCPVGAHPTARELECSGRRYALVAESISDIKRFAGAFDAILRIGAEMAQGKNANKVQWQAADGVINGSDFPVWTEEPIAPWNLSVYEARTYLMMLMRRLLHICNVKPRFLWNKEKESWQIDLDAYGLSNLPGLLAVELMISVAGKDGFAVCSACGRSYIPKRRPDPTRNNYCQKCGIRAAWRNASRKSREKMREQKVD